MPYYHIHEIPTTMFDIMPCHLYTKKLPCHAIHTANHAMPSTMPTTPCHPQCLSCHAIHHANHATPPHQPYHAITIQNTLPHQQCQKPCHITLTTTYKTNFNVQQLDAIALSPAHSHNRGRSNMPGCSSPTKRPHTQSPSQSRSCSNSHSPACHRQHKYVSPNAHGRRTCLTSSNKGKGKGSNPSFFQSGTAASGISTCAVCLGCHKHKYAKCMATKLWNGKKTFIRRNE